MEQLAPLALLIIGMVLALLLLLLAFHIAALLTKMGKRSLKRNILATVIFTTITFAGSLVMPGTEGDMLLAVLLPSLPIGILTGFLLFMFLYGSTIKQALAATVIFTLLFIGVILAVSLYVGLILFIALEGIGEVRVQ